VTSVVDGNGNRREYSVVDANHTKVTVKDSSGNTVYSSTVGFDMNMSQTTITDGDDVVRYSATYADANNPYRPSSTLDGNGYAVGGAGNQGKTTTTWDQYGNVLTMTTPRGKTTTYTYDYTTFALGRLTSVQTAGKAATTFTY
jgi:hypothetical protein